MLSLQQRLMVTSQFVIILEIVMFAIAVLNSYAYFSNTFVAQVAKMTMIISSGTLVSSSIIFIGILRRNQEAQNNRSVNLPTYQTIPQPPPTSNLYPPTTSNLSYPPPKEFVV